jgi:hypothetical protein
VSDAEPPDQITYDLPGALELLATLEDAQEIVVASEPGGRASQRPAPNLDVMVRPGEDDLTEGVRRGYDELSERYRTDDATMI